MNLSFWQVFKTSLMEDSEHGSGKRVIAFIIALVIAFLCIYPTLIGVEIPSAILLELIAFICGLYGISMYKDIKETQSDNSVKKEEPKTITP